MPIIIPVGGSGGANLDITAYSAVGSLPASDDEGAMAVITSTALGDVYISADAPVSPSSGDVWVWIGGQSPAPIALTDLLTIHPRACYQYNGSNWAALESYVYSDSAWVELSLIVYDYGAEILSAMTQRSFGGNQVSTVTYTEQSGAVYILRTSTGDWGYRCYSTDQAIDLTDISTIRMTYTRTSGLTLRLYVSGTNSSYNATASVEGSSGSNLTVNLNVSALSGLYYIGLYSGCWNETNGNGYLYKIELIK